MTKKSSTLLLLIITALLLTSLSVGPIAMAAKGQDDVQADKVFKKDLRLNMRAAEVSDLQGALAKEGLFKVPATGFFGSLTANAVKAFQKKHNLPATGVVDLATRDALNKKSVSKSPSVNSGPGNAQSFNAEAAKKIQELTDKIKQLEAQLKLALEELKKQGIAITQPVDQPKVVTTEAQAAAGIIITGGVSGPGYPTGPLNMVLPSSQLLLDRIGQVSEAAGALNVKDRQFEAPLETIPPTLGSFPITINGVANTATQLKVISNLKAQGGIGQHQGTIDVDIDTVPAGHVTLAYSGTATVAGSTTTSKGTFKTTSATGIFTGLVAEGTYEMTIVESGNTVGSPVMVSLTTVTP